MTQEKEEKKSVDSDDSKEKALILAKLALRPSMNAAMVIADYGTSFGKLDFIALANQLSDSVTKTIDGNMDRCEGMLLSQAHALQSIFTGLSQKAVQQSQLKHYNTFLKLALKAQSQCRTTIETLATLKRLPVIFANQANIAQGHQQVNNTVQLPAQASGTEKIKFAPNELLETQHEERLEHRAASPAGSSDSPRETVAKVHRPKIVRRQAKSFP